MSIQTNTAALQSILDAVNALPNSTGSTSLQEKTVTPSASTQTVTPDNGYGGLSKVTVNGDSNLVAANIKSGTSIFGVTGTLATGASVQTKTGTFTTNSSGKATVSNVGFKPDLVVFSTKDDGNNFESSVGFAFTAFGQTSLGNKLVPSTYNGYVFSICMMTQTSTGFTVEMTRANSSFTFTNDTNRTISYTAIKYT